MYVEDRKLSEMQADALFAKKRKIKKELLQGEKERRPLRIALLSGTTIGQFKDILELFLLELDILPIFYVGQYHRFLEESLYGEELAQFQPELIYIHTSRHNLEEDPNVLESLRAVWEALTKRYACPILQNNFEYATYATKEQRIEVDAANAMLEEAAKEWALLSVHDINLLSMQYGLKNWHDNAVWYQYKYPFSLEAIPFVAKHLANQIAYLLGRKKKLVILDLDNTLWGGVIGECKGEELELSKETPSGMAYQAFHCYLKDLVNKGILLAIASKNEPDAPERGFSHPGSILKLEDFSCVKSNWRAKDENVGEILTTLNLLPEHVVFIDDNPAECKLVEEAFPQMEVLCLTEIDTIVDQLEQEGYFPVDAASVEDKNRTRYYQENEKRTKAMTSFGDYKTYLRSLSMNCRIGLLKEEQIARTEQLLHKTNQFNLTTRRLNRYQLKERMENTKTLVVTASLSDQFGDNGLVSVLIGEKDGESLMITDWVMSCRVFKRNLEEAMMDYLVSYATKNQIASLRGIYLPTAKNRYVEKLYESLGFEQERVEQERTEDDQEKETRWVYPIPQEYQKKNDVMEVMEV